MLAQGKLGGGQGSGQQGQSRGPARDRPPLLGHRRTCTGPGPAHRERGCCHQSSRQAASPPCGRQIPSHWWLGSGAGIPEACGRDSFSLPPWGLPGAGRVRPAGLWPFAPRAQRGTWGSTSKRCGARAAGTHGTPCRPLGGAIISCPCSCFTLFISLQVSDGAHGDQRDQVTRPRSHSRSPGGLLGFVGSGSGSQQP